MIRSTSSICSPIKCWPPETARQAADRKAGSGRCRAGAAPATAASARRGTAAGPRRGNAYAYSRDAARALRDDIASGTALAGQFADHLLQPFGVAAAEHFV